jgi:hypothetical protein
MVAAWTSATRSGLGDIAVISQPAPTACIAPPVFDTTVAIQSARNVRDESGAHGDSCAADVADSFAIGLAWVNCG